jgi:ABC-type glycerol-3-phosphate transport system substrate-binding protein
MHTQTCGYCARIAKDDPEFEFVMASPRQRKAGDPLTSGNNSGDGFCITSASEHKEAALEWGLFTIWPENIGLFVTLADLAPVGTKSQKFWKTEQCTKAWVAQNSKCQFTNQDSSTLWQESKVICAPHIQAAVLGKATVDEALEAIDKELNKTLIEVYG